MNQKPNGSQPATWRDLFIYDVGRCRHPLIGPLVYPVEKVT